MDWLVMGWLDTKFKVDVIRKRRAHKKETKESWMKRFWRKLMTLT